MDRKRALARRRRAAAERFTIGLVVIHPSIDPAVVTSKLGLTPVNSWMAREPRKTIAGEPLEGVRNESMWSCVRKFENSRTFFDSLKRLLQDLTPHADFLRNIRS